MTSVCAEMFCQVISIPIIISSSSEQCTFSDLARDIYQNATIEKIALIRFILDREKKTAQYDEQLNQRIPVCFYAHCHFHQCLTSR